MVVKSTVTAFAEFDDKLVDVMKTTDLTKIQTKALNEELQKINTRTSQIELLSLARVAGKLGIRGKEDILGFVRATDKIKVALSEDLGGDAEESVRQLGKLVDIFKLTRFYSMEESLLKIGSAMNALGASGTANEAYMLEFSKRVAGVAPTAGFTIQQILGLATTLDELGQTSEVAGTAFNQIVSKMFKNTEEYAHIAGVSVKEFSDLLNKDANEAMIQLLIGAKGSAGGFEQLTKSLSALGMDGVRATTVLGALAANIEKLRENQKFSNQEFVKGTDLLTEFNKKNNSAQAQLEKHIKRFKEIQVGLGEKLTPIYAGSVHSASLLLKVFGETVQFLFKYGTTILTITGFIAAYALAVKALVWWQKSYIATELVIDAIWVAQTALFHTRMAAVALYNAAIALMSGNLKKAAVNMRLFSASLSMTPLDGLLQLLPQSWLQLKLMTLTAKKQRIANMKEQNRSRILIF
jgi:TP901 family phage tail tape measure protein